MKNRTQKESCDRRNFIKTSIVLGSAGLGASAAHAQAKPADTIAPVAGNDKKTNAYIELREYLDTIDIIDAHEHLITEPQRLQKDVDVFTLVSHYTYVDMISAGYTVPEGESWFSYNYPQDTTVSLEKRWKDLWPSIENVKHGSYFRAAKIALRDIYGIDDLNEKTYRIASEKIKAANKPGLYRKVLAEKSRIKTCLVQNGLIEGQDPADLLTPIFTGTHQAYALWNKDYIEQLGKRNNTEIKQLDEYIELFDKDMTWARDHGALGCKIFTDFYAPADMDQARRDFKAFLEDGPATAVLKNTILNHIFDTAGKWDWPVAVHTGVWGDYRIVDPKNMITYAQQKTKTRFDVYHLGMPYVRDAIFLAKNFPNVNLNLCWAYILSEYISTQAINEIIDTVPVNKISAFGGDYGVPVENVYGHLVMAKECTARALADRIAKGYINIPDAKKILKMWFYDNPVKFYNIKV